MERKKILIGDNFELDIQEVRKALIAAGYEVRVLQNGSEILPFIETYSPDLLLLEVNLAGLDIEKIVETTRSSESEKVVPIVATSTPRTLDERISVLEKNIDDYLYKPFEIEEVVTRIEVLLKEAQQARAHPQTTSPGFSGSLGEMSLVDLLQTLEVGRKTGIITLQRGVSEGEVFISDGEVVDATLEDLDPKRALSRLFTWANGYFAVSMVHHDRPKKITVSTRDLISEGITRLYRWEELSAQMPPLHAVALLAPHTNGQTFSKEEQDILALLDGKRRFIDIIEASRFDDIKALRLLKNLYERGHLIDAPAHENIIDGKYLDRYRVQGTNGYAREMEMAGIFSTIFREPDMAVTFFNDRRHANRRRGERRRYDRRKATRLGDNKICLNKSELILVREKLISSLRDPTAGPNSDGRHANR